MNCQFIMQLKVGMVVVVGKGGGASISLLNEKLVWLMKAYLLGNCFLNYM